MLHKHLRKNAAARKWTQERQDSDTLAWLNTYKDATGSAGTAYRRVSEILRLSEQLIGLDTERNYPAASLLRGRTVTSTPEQKRNIEERRKTAARLNQLLRRYVTFPRVEFSADRLGFRWVPISSGQRYNIERTFSNVTYRFGEAEAILGVLNLEARARRLGRGSKRGRGRGPWFSPVCRCQNDRCGKWSARRVRHQNFCNKRCRWAYYMREVVRPDQKEKERRAKQAIGFVE